MDSKIKHIAFIMDGNRRWAKSKNLTTYDGYKAGVRNLEKIVECISEKFPNIVEISLYALSSDNMKRGDNSGIFELFHEDFSVPEDVKIEFIGSKENLPDFVIEKIKEIEEKNLNSEKKVNIFFNHSFKIELDFLKKNPHLLEETNGYPLCKNVSSVDILIRTGGHKRLSGFCPLIVEYSELFFTKTLWPDLSVDEIIDFFMEYNRVEKNFGL